MLSSYLKSPEAEAGGFQNCPEFLERYLNYLSDFQGRRPNTIIEFYLVLKEYLQYVHYRRVMRCKPSTCDAHKDMDITKMALTELTEITTEDFDEYICFLDAKTGLAAGTITKKTSMIRSFYSYLLMMQEELEICMPNGNPAQGIKGRKARQQKPKILTLQQIDRLLRSVPGDTALRDQAMILVILTTGISLSELVALNRNDVSRDGAVRIRAAGKKPARTVYLTGKAKKAVDAYLQGICGSSESRDSSPLFLSSETSGRLTARMVRKRIATAGANAKMGALGITPKDLRDTAIAMMLQSVNEDQRRQILMYFGMTDANAGSRFGLSMRDTLARSPISKIGEDSQ